MINVQPLRKDRAQLQLLPDHMRKAAGSVAGGKMPTIFIATRDGATTFDEKNVAVAGFRYRRASHHCEVTWWGGHDPELLSQSLKALQCQAIMEGRKRVECFSEQENPDFAGTQYERGGETFNKAMEIAGFQAEGMHRYWTKNLEDVHVYGWVWLKDGLPEIDSDTQVFIGDNETVEHYKNKNIELYVKDRDYYAKVDYGNMTFADHIIAAQKYVTNLNNVTIVPGWSAKGV